MIGEGTTDGFRDRTFEMRGLSMREIPHSGTTRNDELIHSDNELNIPK